MPNINWKVSDIDNKIVEFGSTINNYISQYQGGNSEDIVLDKEKITSTYPCTLNVNTNIGEISTKLFLHFCQSLHMAKSNTEYEQWIQKNPNYKNDERVVFVYTND